MLMGFLFFLVIFFKFFYFLPEITMSYKENRGLNCIAIPQKKSIPCALSQIKNSCPGTRIDGVAGQHSRSQVQGGYGWWLL